MASTYVNDLRLNEMATGDASGSWGTVTNTNLELIGEAFSYGTETIGDADSTLTIADGAADAARSFYLKITSSVDLTTTRIVTLGPNTVSKVWMIENATTGSQVITIKQGSGATINVPNGQVKMISTDGAGSGGAVLDLLVDVDLTGTTTLVNLDVSGTLGVTGVLTATSLDISGDIDVDGTTNLDVVDIDGAVDMASTLLVTGVLTTTAATVSNGGGQFNGAINVGVDDTGYDVKFFGATTGKSLLWDESADSLIVTGTTTLVGTTNLDAVDIDGATQIDATVTVGVDDTGYDVKFFGATAGAYMLWDESADDLILGGAAGLSVNSAALVTGVLTANGGAVFNESGADVDFRVESDTNANALFVQGSDGFVGIGTSSPDVFSRGDSKTLGIQGATTASLGVNAASGSTASIYVGQNGVREGQIVGASGSMTINAGSSNYLSLGTDFTERMRLDASGSLLVGKTAAGIANAGSEFSSTGRAFFTFDNGGPLQLNRLNNDGDIIELHKDGTEVGSIGALSSRLYIGTAETGLFFNNSSGAITPFDVDGLTQTDADVDLGVGSIRFKDLYLSGGVYLGGTGAANKLDDYEEGTFTPSVSAASGSYTSVTATGKYIKVGRSVTLRMRVVITTNGTAAGAMFLGNIPFPTTDSNDWGGGTREDVGTGDGYVFSGQGTTSIYINKYDGTYGLTSGRGFTFCISYIAA
jgi:hypothetical protein